MIQAWCECGTVSDCKKCGGRGVITVAEGGLTRPAFPEEVRLFKAREETPPAPLPDALGPIVRYVREAMLRTDVETDEVFDAVRAGIEEARTVLEREA